MKNEGTLLKDEMPRPSTFPKKRIMIAGIGNIFLSDDGFGVEVIKRLQEKKSSADLEINNTGIGGLKLAYDLMKGYDGLILIDASARGEEPGTLYVIEPDEKDVHANLEDGSSIDPHGADCATILRFVKALNAWPPKVIIIGCEPETIEDFSIGLSDRVARSVSKAVELVEEIVNAITQT